MRTLNVPLIAQRPELPTGCEITAITMLLQYTSVQVDKVQLAKEMPYDQSDCDQGFVGDPFADSGNSIYPPALMNLITRYAGHATNLTGADLPRLKAQIDQDHPVVVWVGEFDGFHTHALVMVGYDDHAVIVNDCWTNQVETIPNQQFAEIRARLDNRAITV